MHGHPELPGTQAAEAVNVSGAHQGGISGGGEPGPGSGLGCAGWGSVPLALAGKLLVAASLQGLPFNKRSR